jgi:hypothetical protein
MGVGTNYLRLDAFVGFAFTAADLRDAIGTMPKAAQSKDRIFSFQIGSC